MSPALALEGLSKRYGALDAVRDVSFEVRPGEIFGFLGPNGAGKTTTLRMVLDLVQPTSGRLSILGRESASAVRNRIGFLPEERGLYRRMTPIDAIVFFAGLKGVRPAVARKRGLDMLEAQGLAAAATRPMKALSKGMAQKVQLICAVAHAPELVILDEPFSGLDPVNQQGLEQLIRDLAARGATVVFSTHVMAHAERLCERLVLMARGRKAFEGTVAQARAEAPRALILDGAIPPEAAAALPGVTGVQSAPGAEPPRLILTLAKGARPADALRAAFAQGLDVQGFEAREPSLHDAFIILTGEGRA